MRAWLAKPELMELAGLIFAAKQILEAGGLLFIILQRRHPPSGLFAIDNYSIYNKVLSSKIPLDSKLFLKSSGFRLALVITTNATAVL